MKNLSSDIKRLNELHQLIKTMQLKFERLNGGSNDYELFNLSLRGDIKPGVQLGLGLGSNMIFSIDSLVLVGFFRIETKSTPNSILVIELKHNNMDLLAVWGMTSKTIYFSSPVHKFRTYMSELRDITERKLLELHAQQYEANYRRQHG